MAGDLEYRIKKIASKISKRNLSESQDRLQRIYKQLGVTKEPFAGDEMVYLSALSDLERLKYGALIAPLYNKCDMRGHANTIIAKFKENYRTRNNAENYLEANKHNLENIPDAIKNELLTKYGKDRIIGVLPRHFKHETYQETRYDIYVDGKEMPSKTISNQPKPL
ncbi:hypothetical protein JXB27_04050 [Candidatus Woesearchaeota archaeon]|nr:hypothetical protein [Candidatus Woesearchaeota archaeon]